MSVCVGVLEGVCVVDVPSVGVAVDDAEEVAVDDTEEVAVAVDDAEEVAVAEEVSVAEEVAVAEEVSVAEEVGDTAHGTSVILRNVSSDICGRAYTASSFCKSIVMRVRDRPVRIQIDVISTTIRTTVDGTVVSGRLTVRFQRPDAGSGAHTSSIDGVPVGTMYSCRGDGCTKACRVRAAVVPASSAGPPGPHRIIAVMIRVVPPPTGLPPRFNSCAMRPAGDH